MTCKKSTENIPEAGGKMEVNLIRHVQLLVAKEAAVSYLTIIQTVLAPSPTGKSAGVLVRE